jgi:hypothetical protein
MEERKEKRRREEEREEKDGAGDDEEERKGSKKKKKDSKKEKKKASSRHHILRSLIHVPPLDQQQSHHAKDHSLSNAETKESTEENEVVPSPAAELSIAATSKSDFFAKLFAKEKLAPPVGTFHATGKKSDESHAPHESTTDWLCPKCNTSNYRHSHQCQKCKAVKRLSAWR